MSDALPSSAGAEHLTAALRRSGVLGDARVQHAAVESMRTTIMSRIIRLRLAYDGAAPDAPPSVILKTAHPERIDPAWVNGRQEVAFYRDVAPAMADGMVPRCFDAHWDAATGDWYLLLEDLTDSHATPVDWPLPPGAEDCARIVAARARFQSAWWGDPRLGTSIGSLRDGANVDAYAHALAERFARFIDRFPDLLSPERRALYQRLLAAAPRLFSDACAAPNVTIVQGDSHVWNCFLPRDGGDDVKLFDWDGWRVGTGATDLAQMMTLHWYPDRRRRLERSLLDRYHAVLLAHGVAGYSREALTADYRQSTLRLLMWPIWQAVNDVPAVIWWNNLERLLLAVKDLGCAALLDR